MRRCDCLCRMGWRRPPGSLRLARGLEPLSSVQPPPWQPAVVAVRRCSALLCLPGWSWVSSSSSSCCCWRYLNSLSRLQATSFPPSTLLLRLLHLVLSLIFLFTLIGSIMTSFCTPPSTSITHFTQVNQDHYKSINAARTRIEI